MLIHTLIETLSNFFHFDDLKRIKEKIIKPIGIKADLN